MSEIAAEPVARPGVFTLTIRSKAALYAAWMPLLKGGGIFLPSNRSHALGEEVLILLSLLGTGGSFLLLRQYFAVIKPTATPPARPVLARQVGP